MSQVPLVGPGTVVTCFVSDLFGVEWDVKPQLSRR